MKICSKCNIEKELLEFNKRKNSKDGHRGVCKICYRLANKTYSMNFYRKNTKKVLDRKKSYRQTERFKELDRKRRKDPATIYRNSLNSIIKRIDSKKEDKTVNMFGYSIAQFKEHFESLFKEGMSWSNHGEWHIDHIIPISSFPKGTEVRVINSLSNLQPLWAIDNLSKGSKILYV